MELNELVDKEAKKGLDLEQPDYVSQSIARERAMAYMLRSWRKRISNKEYLGTNNFLYTDKYLQRTSHVAKRHPPMAYMGRDNRLMARFTRTVTGHAPIGEFRTRFKLPGDIECPCGTDTVGAKRWTRAHTLLRCPLWFRSRAWWSRQTQHIQELDPFMGILPFLKTNPLAFTFEVANVRAKAIEQIEEGNYTGEAVSNFFDIVSIRPQLRAAWMAQYRDQQVQENPDQLQGYDDPRDIPDALNFFENTQDIFD